MDIGEIKEFFFKGMLACWLADIPSPFIEGPWTFFQYTEGPWCFEDRFVFNAKSGKSAGTITICHNDICVWVMHYAGKYRESTIEFVRAALRRARKDQAFSGGRGPMTFSDPGFPGFQYANAISESDFAKFWGKESVVRRGRAQGTQLGYHIYWGMLLI